MLFVSVIITANDFKCKKKLDQNWWMHKIVLSSDSSYKHIGSTLFTALFWKIWCSNHYHLQYMVCNVCLCMKCLIMDRILLCRLFRAIKALQVVEANLTFTLKKYEQSFTKLKISWLNWVGNTAKHQMCLKSKSG